jgi:hypothetical protein
MCRRCGIPLPPGHGYCLPCACYVDGFDAGATYSDDFEGVSEGEAIHHHGEIAHDAWEQYADGDSDVAFTDEALRAHYLRGLLAGLKRAAQHNAERAAEYAECAK